MDKHVYLMLARRLFLERLLQDGQATCEMQEILPRPEGVSPQTLGSIPRPLAAAGLISPMGASRANRAARHGGLSTVWRLADRRGAERYLNTIPAVKTPSVLTRGTQTVLPFTDREGGTA